MSGKLLIAVIVALLAYVAATKTKVSVQPEVHTKTRFLPKIIKLPEIDVVPTVTISEEPQEEPVEAPAEEAAPEPEVAVKPPVELYTQPQEIAQPQPAAQVQYTNSCGPNGCYSRPVQQQYYRTYQPRGFRPLRRLFGR